MKNIILTIVLLFPFIIIKAQDKSISGSSASVHIGYGTENNYGNTTFFGGFGVEKNLRKKFIIGADITRFTTNIYNAYKDQTFDNEERFYKGWFITPKAGYNVVGNNTSSFTLTIAAGPAVKYYNYKMFKSGLVKNYPDGRRIPVDSTIRWYTEKDFNLSLYTGISFNFEISTNVKASIFIDTYGHEIAIEHFMPGIKVYYKL